MIPINEVSTPALAYLGDCVIELMVRSRLVESGLSTSAHLNKEALAYVKASAQAEAMERILPLLSPEELSAYKRGRNSGHLNIPKSASPAQYRMATGMETLFGYLHMTNNQTRAEELFLAAYPIN